MEQKYDKITEEKNRFDAFEKDLFGGRIPLEFEAFVLPHRRIVLVRNRTHYGDADNTLERVVFPNGDWERLSRDRSHAGREAMYGLFSEVYASFSMNLADSDARYGIISFDDTEKIEKILRMGMIQRTSAEDIQEGERIYRTLVKTNEYGPAGSGLIFQFMRWGLKPNQVLTDVIENSIEINAEGDHKVGWDTYDGKPVNYEDIVFALSDFKKVRLNLKGTSVTSGEYRGLGGYYKVDFSKPEIWSQKYPISLKSYLHGLYIDVTNTKVHTTGATIFENGKVRTVTLEAV